MAEDNTKNTYLTLNGLKSVFKVIKNNFVKQSFLKTGSTTNSDGSVTNTYANSITDYVSKNEANDKDNGYVKRTEANNTYLTIVNANSDTGYIKKSEWVQSDWNETAIDSKGYIKNKPNINIPDVSNFVTKNEIYGTKDLESDLGKNGEEDYSNLLNIKNRINSIQETITINLNERYSEQFDLLMNHGLYNDTLVDEIYENLNKNKSIYLKNFNNYYKVISCEYNAEFINITLNNSFINNYNYLFKENSEEYPQYILCTDDEFNSSLLYFEFSNDEYIPVESQYVNSENYQNYYILNQNIIENLDANYKIINIVKINNITYFINNSFPLSQIILYSDILNYKYPIEIEGTNEYTYSEIATKKYVDDLYSSLTVK